MSKRKTAFESPLELFILGLIVTFIMMLVAPATFAGDDDCRGNSCNDRGDIDIDIGGDDIDIDAGDVTVPVEVNNDIAGDNVSVNHTSKSRALALSNNLGDVDIAGCLGSTQWATPIYSRQKLVVNWPCLAEFYLRNGKYELAAMAICNTEVEKEFASEAECEAAHAFEPPPAVTAAAEPIHDELERRQRIYQEQLALYEDRVDELAQTVQQIANRPAPRPRPAQTTVQQVPFLDEAKRKALAELRSEDEE